MTVERKPSVLGAVLGSYRITGALGSGGMGAVFTAKHVTTGVPAAVKVLRKELTDNAEVVQRFFDEAYAATRIRHAGIIEVYDFGYGDDGVAYLAMELLEGVTLRQRLDQQKTLSETAAVAIARSVAEALAAAHAAGIIHRDLKPDNIFLVGGDRPKVLDFGIAKLLDREKDEASRTRTGSLIGTPIYMAPEQARAAGSIDPRADLYSLGCILYEMVSGRPPFAGNVGELLAAHMFTQPEPIATISPRLDALIAKLLAKEPHERPRDAQAVVDALGGAVLVVRRVFDDAPPEVVVQKRSAMPIIAAVATLAIAATTLGFVFVRGSSDDDPPPPPKPAAIVEPAPVAPPAKPNAPPSPKPVVVAPIPTPPPAPPGPAKVVVKHQPHTVEHPVDHSNGPVTMPGGPVTSPGGGPVTMPGGPVATPEPLVTPKGAPLSKDP